MSDASLIEHSITLPNGVKVIARKEGIEVRTVLNSFTEEVITTLRWEAIEHLRSLQFNNR
jgi:hypothetical protein